MARDAIIAVPGEVMESQSAQGAAKAVLKRAPTIIFRPAIGATKALGQTLLGATNTLDPEHRRRMDAVCSPLCLMVDPLLTLWTEIQEALSLTPLPAPGHRFPSALQHDTTQHSTERVVSVATTITPPCPCHGTAGTMGGIATWFWLPSVFSLFSFASSALVLHHTHLYESTRRRTGITRHASRLA